MTGRVRRPFAVGMAIVALYLVVAVLTPALSGRHVRPLFDSFGTGQPYHWVKPPREFAASNIKPPATESVDVQLGLNGSVNSGPATADSQAIISMVEGAIPAHASDTKVVVTFDALDAATLGPLPPGDSADGNAYRISAKYSPSSTPIAAVTKPGNVALESAVGADGILFSADGGKTWKPLETFALGGGTRVAGVFSQFGIYLSARSPNAPKPSVVTTSPTTGTGGSSSSSGPAIAIGVIGASVVAVVIAAVLLRRRR